MLGRHVKLFPPCEWKSIKATGGSSRYYRRYFEILGAPRNIISNPLRSQWHGDKDLGLQNHPDFRLTVQANHLLIRILLRWFFSQCKLVWQHTCACFSNPSMEQDVASHS